MDSLPLVLASLPFVLRQLSHRNRPPSEQQSSGKSNNKGQNRMVHWWNFGVVIFLCDLLYGQWWCHAVIYLQQEMNFNKGLNQLHVCYRLCLVQLDFFFYGGIHFDPELPGFGKHKKLPFSSKVHHVNYEGDREQIEQLKGFHKDTTHPHLLCLYHTTVSPPHLILPPLQQRMRDILCNLLFLITLLFTPLRTVWLIFCVLTLFCCFIQLSSSVLTPSLP